VADHVLRCTVPRDSRSDSRSNHHLFLLFNEN
jgi:hypothetical protein